MYLATDGAKKGAFRIGVGLLDNIEGLESLSRSSSGEIDLEGVELGRFNAELGP